jgi:cytochrome oxidase Cu insertion factor (SCO1/SenC/PrrC family)
MYAKYDSIRPDETIEKEDRLMAMLKAGERAADFGLTDQFGKKLQLKDFKGRKVLLYFFPKAGTSG